MLTLFHSPQSRSTRFLWLLEELGAEYEVEYVTIPRMDGSGAPDPKNPHPEKKVPALLHDGHLVTESVAVALYLAWHFWRKRKAAQQTRIVKPQSDKVAG